jgi:hypothetical protein
MAKIKRLKSKLGSSPEVHTKKFQYFFQKANRDYQAALKQDDCHSHVHLLLDASRAIGIARAHVIDKQAKQSTITVDDNIDNALDKALKKCLRD